MTTARWQQLQRLEKAGKIRGLSRNVSFPLTTTSRHRGVTMDVTLGHFVADYFYNEGEMIVVEEARPRPTKLFRWQQKHFEAEYPYITFRAARSR